MAVVKKILRKIASLGNQKTKGSKIRRYLDGGAVPWSVGYNEYKFDFIEKQIRNADQLRKFTQKTLGKNYGLGLDERVVEYPWIFSRINDGHANILDAGSTFNYQTILDSISLDHKRLTIFTYFPEKNCFHSKRINYVFGDLRDVPFKDSLFDLIVCQSTIEHVGMDNKIYGYSDGRNSNDSPEYLKVIDELVRVLASKGKLLLTFPFGKYKNYDFFQQFDSPMLTNVCNRMKEAGSFKLDFFKYEKEGWRFAAQEELTEVIAYNPHTGEGKLDDGAAHCRSIACIEFEKK